MYVIAKFPTFLFNTNMALSLQRPINTLWIHHSLSSPHPTTPLLLLPLTLSIFQQTSLKMKY